MAVDHVLPWCWIFVTGAGAIWDVDHILQGCTPFDVILLTMCYRAVDNLLPGRWPLVNGFGPFATKLWTFAPFGTWQLTMEHVPPGFWPFFYRTVNQVLSGLGQFFYRDVDHMKSGSCAVCYQTVHHVLLWRGFCAAVSLTMWYRSVVHLLCGHWPFVTGPFATGPFVSRTCTIYYRALRRLVDGHWLCAKGP